jgi:diaminobutyrate-2-oxoglutarate transaminase
VPDARETLESEVRLYSRAFPATFERARGAELFAADGSRYIDFFCGAGALNYGHNHPAIKARVTEHLAQDGIVHALDADTVAKRAFLERFGATVLGPRGLPHRVQFPGPTGTNAVEAVLKLARKATGRTGVVAFSGSFHGMTLGSLAVTANRPRTSLGIPVGHTTFVPYPDGPLGSFDSIAYLRRLLDDEFSGVELPAAVIVETVQMDGGVYIAPEDWLRELRALTEERGVLLICDEVQIGCGRSGRFFSFERAGIVPDLVTISKSLGGLGLPLSACLLAPELDVWEPGEHTGTFRSNQLALVAATAALELWDDPAFVEGITARVRRLEERLAGVLADHPDVRMRQIGMAVGLECASEDGRWAARAQQTAFESGLVLETCGRSDSVLKVCPPLTIELDVLDEGCEILAAAASQLRAAYA